MSLSGLYFLEQIIDGRHLHSVAPNGDTVCHNGVCSGPWIVAHDVDPHPLAVFMPPTALAQHEDKRRRGET